ncbi:MAG: hypothetical protein V1790_17625 [Planctomycetota bacterium]
MAWTLEARQKAAETRERHKREKAVRQARSEARRESGVFAGVGESKVFVAPEGSMEREIDIAQCHMGGKLIADLHFTPEQVALIAFRNTDEGIAAFESETGKKWETRTYSPPTEDREFQNFENPDILKDTASAFAKPGMAQRFLGEKRCNQAGLRGWNPVKNKRGELVKVGRNLFLGEMPEEMAAKRRARNKAESDAQQKEIGERMQVNQERFVREGGLAIRPGEILRSGGQPVAAEGVHIRRGNAVE